MNLRVLMLDLMYSWQNAYDDQVTKWENGEDWPEMDALIDFRHLTSQSSQPDNACPKYHKDAKKQGWSICPYCDKKLSGG